MKLKSYKRADVLKEAEAWVNKTKIPELELGEFKKKSKKIKKVQTLGK